MGLMRRWGKEALLACSGVLLAGAVGWLLLDYVIMPTVTRQGMHIRVPDVTGKSPAEAQESLARLGLRFRVKEDRWSPRIPAGMIISQEPAPATEVKGGRTVYTTVSRGDKSCVVPDLTMGISLREARFRVEQAGLAVGRVQEIPTDSHPGVVVNQHPGPGTELARGAVVDLGVSRGQLPTVPTPNLVGANLDSALALLEALELGVGHIEHRERPGVRADTVLEQTPPAGAEIHGGDSVDLIVSE